MKTDVLEATVVAGNFCSGCGVCVHQAGNQAVMKLDEFGKFVPSFSQYEKREDVDVTCPFSDGAKSETDIGRDLYGSVGALYSDEVGYYRSIYAGWALSNLRASASSGGIIRWFLVRLLEERVVTGVVAVDRVHDKSKETLFAYRIISSVDEVKLVAKSAYYPVELSDALDQIRSKPGRYAITAIPCFAKAIRLAMEADPILASRVVCIVGLVCGHLKTTAYADYLGWQKGIGIGEITEFDFRSKLPGRTANQKGISIKSDRRSVVDDVRAFRGTNYGLGFFKYNACDYCDDVFAECADISVGDAWLERYIGDNRGTSLIVVRSNLASEILERGIADGGVNVDALPLADVIKSQLSGLRHRRAGLKFRLSLEQKGEKWRPTKREFTVRELTKKEKKIQKVRMDICAASHTAFRDARRCGDIRIFEDRMAPLEARYFRLYRNYVKRFKQWLKSRLDRSGI